LNLKFPLFEVAKSVLSKRYVHFSLGEKDWSDVVNRVIGFVVPGREEEFRELLLERYFLPNSPTLVNAGTKISGLAACFTLDMEDSLEGIYKTKYRFAKICQKGGGVGISLAKLRPEGMPVAGSTHSKAAGPIKFFNTICEDGKALTQAGFREAAIMGTMPISHPDVEKFIVAKTEEGKMSTANISVMVTDEFMQAVLNDESWHLYFSTDNNTKSSSVSAKKLFDLISKQAWQNGEPGLIYVDTVNNNSPYRFSGQVIETVNACAEEPLPFFGACVLGSIDLSKFYEDGRFNWNFLAEVTRKAIIFLDSIIDVSTWPIPEIEEWVKNNRAVGLGVMGFADLLLKMGIPYGSSASIQWAEDLGHYIYGIAHETSVALGIEKGVPEACKNLPTPRRNVTLLSVAPTGSLAILSGCSHGIEPNYAPETTRRDKTGTYVIKHPEADKDYFRSAINEDKLKRVSWKEHIDILSAWQKYVDAGCSKTINMPNEATTEDVKSAFIYAWQVGCKAVTVYRDGSRQVQVLSAENPKISGEKENPVTVERPHLLESKTFKIKNGAENTYVTISYKDNKPYEVFVNAPSTLLHDIQSRDAVSRLSSLALRYGVPTAALIKELKQIPAQTFKSVPLQIASTLEEIAEAFLKCPNCGGVLELKEGCKSCSGCGYSACS
jgi:ribonucleoside-diphosphate reductase alpha chain